MDVRGAEGSITQFTGLIILVFLHCIVLLVCFVCGLSLSGLLLCNNYADTHMGAHALGIGPLNSRA